MRTFSLLTLTLPFTLSAQSLGIYPNGYGSTDINMRHLSTTDEYAQYAGLWGYVGKDGLEYAILGTNAGTAIYSLKNPAAPRRDTFVPGNNSIWREVKSYKDYVYVATDQGNHGLLIINMKEAPQKITWKYNRLPAPTAINPGVVGNCHNLWIDEKGILYLCGCSPQAGGVLMYDLNNQPEDPEYLGSGPAVYSHDAYVRGDTLFSSEIYAGNFSVYLVRDRKNVRTLATQSTSSRFTHNAWLSDDGKYLFTTDEKPQGKVDAYDVSNLSDIKRLYSFRPPVLLNTNSLTHNTHFIRNAKGRFIVTSWYDEGVSVADVTDPSHIVETAIGRTTKGGDGCWGVYPFLPSGLIIASDINNGLLLFQPQYTPAVRYAGVVLDSISRKPIGAVKIVLKGNLERETLSDGLGQFKTGSPELGNIGILFSKAGYVGKRLDRRFSLDQPVIRDTILLAQQAVYSLGGLVRGKEDAAPIADARIGVLVEEEIIASTITDRLGVFAMPGLYAAAYQVAAAKWGFIPSPFERVVIPPAQTVPMTLTPGYADHFLFDLGWRTSGTASSGTWERGSPISTTYAGAAVAPDKDSPRDEGNMAFVTGNIGGDPGVGDVDNGWVGLHSPSAVVSTGTRVNLVFDIWFFNGGGSTLPDDTLKIYVSNLLGDSVLLYKHYENTRQWTTVILPDILQKIKAGTQLRFHFIASDLGSPHLLEAGIDNFRLETTMSTASKDQMLSDPNFTLFPNPSTGSAQIRFLKTLAKKRGVLKLIQADGRIFETRQVDGELEITLGEQAPPGTYFVQWISAKGDTLTAKWLKIP